MQNNRYIVSTARWVGVKFSAMKKSLFFAKGKMTTLSIFTHNFMDACHLDQTRTNACVFMAMTSKGPVSMCLHNAKRDKFILQPVAMPDKQEMKYWHPLNGKITKNQSQIIHDPIYYPLKKLKGRLRQSKIQRQHL